jgi:hypothetical protein
MLRNSRTYAACAGAGDFWSWSLQWEYGAFQDEATCNAGSCHPYRGADQVSSLLDPLLALHVEVPDRALVRAYLCARL